MKWRLFKQKAAVPGRIASSGRRVTGVVPGLPRSVEMLLAFLLFVACTVGAGWGAWRLFTGYYFHSKSLFVLHDLSSNVTINTGKTLTPELICEILGLKEGINLFSVPIEQRRRDLLEQAPNIRDISIVRRMPDKLVITIVEREPIARVGASGRVVDEEGVVFIRYAGTGGLPMIRGSDALAQVKPGDHLQGMDWAAVRLVTNTLRPDCRVRLLVVDTSKEDNLFITLSDHRQAKIAWDGMQDPEKNTERRMQQQLDNLAKAMDSEIGRSCQIWDATHSGRIFATPPGEQ